MERGDVYLLSLQLPDRETGVGTVSRNKYVIVLRGGEAAAAEREVPVLVASSDRRGPNQPLRSFEVSVGTKDGFQHATLIDSRWVHTLPKADFAPSAFRFRLGPVVMHRVSVALVAGLQMH